MKAAVFTGSGKPLDIRDVPKPEIGPNEVLVKVAACGVCHTDLHYIDHGVPTAKQPPMILGHEPSGTVAEVGSAVKDWQEGDRVILPAVYSCGICRYCRTGRENICERMVMFGNMVDGAYAEYVAAPAKDIFRLPDELPLEESSIIADAISTPYFAVVNRGQVKAGDTVLILGCGGVGMSAVQIAASVGASVIAVDIVPQKLEMAKKMGAAYVINAGEVENLPKAVKKISGGGVDVAFEVIGNPETQRQAFDSLRKGGRFVVVGYTHKELPLSAAKIMFFELEVVGSLGCRPVDYPKIIELARLGRIKVDELVTGKMPLEKINEAFDLLRQGDPGTIRTIVLP